MKTTINGEKITALLQGRIDSNNATEIGDRLISIARENADKRLVLDCADLIYISSAGLRVLIKLQKESGFSEIVNVTPEVYDILSVTGFTELFSVHKLLREITVDEKDLLGAGANGRVYRLDSERIVKVYNSVSNPPEKIEREKASARQAFIHGIPSAIPFDMVRVGDEYGMIYELINAKTLGAYVHQTPETLEKYARKMSEMLKKLHSTEFDGGQLPDARLALRAWVEIGERSGLYRSEDIEMVYALIDSIPQCNTFIHGDFHPGNIMVSDDELLLIDMGDASVGHPIIDLLGSYQIMRILAGRGDAFALRYTGMTTDETSRMWKIFISDYLGTDDSGKIACAEITLHSYALIRSLAGVSFSNLIPEEMRKEMSVKIMGDILEGIRSGATNPQNVDWPLRTERME